MACGTAPEKGVLEPQTLKELLEIPRAALCHVDLGRMNLLCAVGLPGAEELDLEGTVNQLDQWAEVVCAWTEAQCTC